MPEPKHLDFDQPESKSPFKKKRDPSKPSAPLIPKLPRIDVDVDEVQKGSDRRAVACVNLRLAGAPFHEIAEELGYASATTARTAYIAALSRMNPPEDWETLRRTEEMRAEQQLRRSVSMASAEYLIAHDEDGREIKIPNTDRLRWHEQAGKDLALHAMITGAKAPTRVEMSADTQELNRLVTFLAEKSGAGGDVEADILELDELEAEVVEEE